MENKTGKQYKLRIKKKKKKKKKKTSTKKKRKKEQREPKNTDHPGQIK